MILDYLNVGDYSRMWGYIIDQDLDRFFDHRVIMYLIGLSSFLILIKLEPEENKNA